MVLAEWTVILRFVREAVVTLAAVGTFVVALLGLNAWRRKLFGEVQWDRARRLLRGVYAVGDAIHRFASLIAERLIAEVRRPARGALV